MDFEIIAVDFDGTLCTNNWPDIGKPNLSFIEWLKQKKRDGAKLILWTCRDGDILNQAVAWCKEQGLYFDAINDNIPEATNKFGTNSRKIFANVYFDDKAVQMRAAVWVR